MTKPIIGISVDWQESGDFSDYPHYALRQHYSNAVSACGGTPVLLPYEKDCISSYVDLIDGLIIPGGLFEFPQSWYVDGSASPYDASPRTKNDIALIEAALSEDKPILGICAGMQLIAGIAGCKLTSDLKSYYNTSINHWDEDPVTKLTHDIVFDEGGILDSYFDDPGAKVNSHHQEAVVKLTDDVRLEAIAKDNVIEAISLKHKTYVLGIQWHPEVTIHSNNLDKAIFTGFIDQCS